MIVYLRYRLELLRQLSLGDEHTDLHDHRRDVRHYFHARKHLRADTLEEARGAHSTTAENSRLPYDTYHHRLIVLPSVLVRDR